jgi:hypothetical protein
MGGVKGAVFSPYPEEGVISGAGIPDPEIRIGGFSGSASVPLRSRYTKLQAATIVQITIIFLIARRRFFTSICCLYRSGRYTKPVS